MSDGSMMAGLALANAKLGLVHGIAHPIGAFTHKPHGLICAIALPAVIEFNRQSLSETTAQRQISKYKRMEEIFNEDPIKYVRKLQKAMNIPENFKSFGIKDTDIPIIVENSMGSGSTGANPRKVTKSDIAAFLKTLI